PTTSTSAPYTALFRSVPDEKEWDLDLLRVRLKLERAFEEALLAAVPRDPVTPAEVPARLRDLDEAVSPFGVYMEREATLEQFRRSEEHTSELQSRENL